MIIEDLALLDRRMLEKRCKRAECLIKSAKKQGNAEAQAFWTRKLKEYQSELKEKA
jgi:hypothetical protein